MLDPVIPRLSALVPHFVNWKVKAVQEWHDEHSYASRSDQSASTRQGYIYDRTYGFAKTDVTPIPISVEGKGRERFVVVRDGLGPPIAVWMKFLHPKNLFTSNYWTERTQARRLLASLYDFNEHPLLVICGHTLLVDTIAAEVEIEDVWFTRETPQGPDARRRIVHRIQRLYNRSLGILGAPQPQPSLFDITTEPVGPIVRPRTPDAAPAAGSAPGMPQVQPDQAPVPLPTGEKKQKRAKGA